MQLSEKIASWVAGIHTQALPPEVVASTKWRILDIVGCMLGGAANPDTKAAVRVAGQIFPGAQVHSPAASGLLSLIGAAFVNGTASLVLEFDDSHLESAIHSTSPVVSAALPVALSRKLSGPDLIRAVAVGNELACRLGSVAPGKFHQNAFHPTGVFGTFGAIYAVSRACDLDASKIADAAGIGGSLSSALMASWEDGSAAKSMHAGFAACSAIHAASCAENGLSGPRGVFDGRFGFFRAHVQDKDFQFAFERAAGGLGSHWELLDIAPKAYPCGHYIQPLIDGAIAIRRGNSFALDEIIAIRCAMPRYVIPLVGEPVAEKRRPKTPFHGRFSLHHAMAEALIHGDLDKTSFAEANLTDPRFNNLADCVEVVVDPQMTDRRKLGGTVEIELAGGRKLCFTVPDMRGMPQNPMTEAELARKFRMNARGEISDATADRLLDVLSSLERQSSVDAIPAAMGSEAKRGKAGKPKPKTSRTKKARWSAS